jgi:hypothetical protein
MTRGTKNAAIALSLLVFVTLPGCGDDAVSNPFASGTGGSSGGGDETGLTLSSADGTFSTSADGTASATGATDGSDGSTSDTGDTGEPALPGQTHSQLVGAGDHMSSANYRMVITVGQPTQLQSTHDSANYRLHGGLIGANGSPP